MGPVGHAFPIGKQAARGLGAAFDDVASQGSGGQLIMVAGLPAKFMDQGTEHQGRIHHPSCDHHIGPGREGRYDRISPEIDIGIDHAIGVWKPSPAGHFFCAIQAAQIAAQVIALDNGDLEAKASLGRQGLHTGAAGFRVEAARIGHDLDALGLEFA